MNRLNNTEERIKETLETQEFEFDEANWRAAEELLDKHMPKKKKRRAIFWFIPLLALLGTGIYFGMPYIKDFAGKLTQKSSVTENPAASDEIAEENSGIIEDSDVITSDNQHYTISPETAGEEEEESYLVMAGPPALQVATMAGGHKRKKPASAAGQGAAPQGDVSATGDEPLIRENKPIANPSKGHTNGDEGGTTGLTPKQKTNTPPTNKITEGRDKAPQNQPDESVPGNKKGTEPGNNNKPGNKRNNSDNNGQTNENEEPADKAETPGKTNDKPVISPTEEEEPTAPPAATNDKKADEPEAKKDIAKTDRPDTTAKATQKTEEKSNRPVLAKNSLSLLLGGSFARTINPFDARFGWSPTFGFMYGYYLSPYLQLRAGLGYTYIRAGQLDKTYFSEQYSFGLQQQQTTISTNSLHYLDIPVNAGYAFSDRFMVLGGATFSYLLNTNNTVTKNIISPFGTTSTKEQTAAYRRGINSWDIQLNLGLEARLAARLRMGALFNAGLLDVTRNSYYMNSTDRNQRLQLYLRYDLLLF